MKRNILSSAFILVIALFFNVQGNAQVAINTDGSQPNASAMLDVSSDALGLLIPRITENAKNAIPSPATGLLIFQTDGTSGFYYFDGLAWNTLAGMISITANPPLTSSGGSSPTLGISTPITVGTGGTGATTFATNGIIYGSGTNPFTSVSTFCKVSNNIGISTSSPNSTLHINGSFATAYVGKSAGYTLSATDQVVNVTSNSPTITLPTASGITARVYTIKNSGTGSVTVNTTSSQTIDGASTYTLGVQYKYVTVMSNGSNWIVIGNN